MSSIIDDNRVEEIGRLPSGHVLRRPTQKIKERIIMPRTVDKCDICWARVFGNKMIVTESGGGAMNLKECIPCYVTREHEDWN